MAKKIANKSKSTKASKGVEAPAAEAVVTTTAAEAPAATPAEAAKPAKPAPAPRESKNGVTLPAEGTACRKIFDACSELLAEGKELSFEALSEKLPKINKHTIMTQRQRWRVYSGQSKEAK